MRAAGELGLRYLTLYAFSTENWSRPQAEVATLMRLLEEAIIAELPELMQRNVRLRVIGRPTGVPATGAPRASSASCRDPGQHRPQPPDGLQLRRPRRAARRLPRAGPAGLAAESSAPDAISESDVSRALYTADIPDPDLLIRTSGEMRISNFLLWQIAYTELWVTPTLWPDFGPADLYRAVAEFQGRTRRFGGV